MLPPAQSAVSSRLVIPSLHKVCDLSEGQNFHTHPLNLVMTSFGALHSHEIDYLECGTKRDEATGGWRILHNEELHNLYASPDIRVIKSRRMGWVGNVARMG
jgi:hypothetical protein